MESNYRSSLIQGLNNELYDIVFIPDVEYYSINQVIMDFQYAAIGNAQLIVPKTNHLYQKESVEIEELDGESIFLFADGTSDSPQKVLREFFNREEIIPHYKLLHKDAFNINNSFFEANAIILIDCFFSGSKGAGIRQIPLNGYFNGILCVWKKNTHKEKYIRQFSEVLKEICEIPIELLPVVDI